MSFCLFEGYDLLFRPPAFEERQSKQAEIVSMRSQFALFSGGPDRVDRRT